LPPRPPASGDNLNMRRGSHQPRTAGLSSGLDAPEPLGLQHGCPERSPRPISVKLFADEDMLEDMPVTLLFRHLLLCALEHVGEFELVRNDQSRNPDGVPTFRVL
jgi:hypothetical protein